MVVAARVAVVGIVTGGIVLGGGVLVGVLGGGQALAATLAVPAAPLAGSASATLTQVNALEWTTTVYLDTAALCAGDNPAGNTFSLVTGKPNSVTGAAAPAYPDGPLACGAAAANPVTAGEAHLHPVAERGSAGGHPDRDPAAGAAPGG